MKVPSPITALVKGFLCLSLILFYNALFAQSNAIDSVSHLDVEDETIRGIPTRKQRSKLIRQLKVIKADRKKVDKYIQVATSLLYKPDKKKAVKFDSVFLVTEQAGVLARELNYTHGISAYYMMMGEAHCSKNDFVSMKKIIELSPDTTKVILLDILSSRYWYSQHRSNNVEKIWQLDSAIRYSSLCLEAALKFRRPDFVTKSADIIIWTAGMFGKYERFDRQIEVLDQFANKYGYVKEWSRAILKAAYANAAMARGDFQLAINLYHQAEAEKKPDDDPIVNVNIKTGLARLYEKNNDYEKVIAMLRPNLLDFDKPTDNYEDRLRWTLMVVKNLNRLNKPMEAIEVIEEIYEKYGLTVRMDSLRYNLCMGLSYQTLKKFKDAEPYYVRAIQNSRQEYGEKILLVYGMAINFYIRSGDFERADYYLKYMKEYLKIKTVDARSTIYKYAFQIDSARGNYHSALINYMQNIKISDSVFKLNKHSEYRNLETRYNTEKIKGELLLKEKDIQAITQGAELLNQKAKLSVQDAALQKLKLNQAELVSKKDQADLKLKDQNIEFLNKQAALQQSQIDQQSIIRNIIIVVICLLAVIIILLFRQYLLKKRSNRTVTQKNQLLQQLVTEKNWLLKEMHHRVKNNLQTIVSLLESQSTFLANNEALSAIQDSQNRVNAMSLIHQKLYQGESLQFIDMSSYLPELINYLKDSFDTQQKIFFKVDIHNIELDVTQAIPVGLIINEAITNSIKYAFKSEKNDATICVIMKVKDDKSIALTISDNGYGLPSDFDSSKIRHGLGLNLIRGLSEDIEGSFTMHSEQGVSINVFFKANTPVHRTAFLIK